MEGAVEFALKNGYKHIDTATAYRNEAEVGKGIKASGVARTSFFLTTKLDNPDQKDPEVALKYSLEQLGTDYLDLCERYGVGVEVLFTDGVQGSCTGLPRCSTARLPINLCVVRFGHHIHHLIDKQINWLDTWKKMEEIYKKHPEKVKAIGLSFVATSLEPLMMTD